MEIIISILFNLIIRSPIIYLKARLWEWIWKKICKKDKFESIYACMLSLPPILICFFNMATKHIRILTTAMMYNIISNGILSIVIYYFLQKEREKKVKINVAGRLNTPEYKYYSQILDVPPGKINTERLIKTYMEKRRKAESKEEREQIELAYLYFTNYQEYKIANNKE